MAPSLALPQSNQGREWRTFPGTFRFRDPTAPPVSSRVPRPGSPRFPHRSENLRASRARNTPRNEFAEYLNQNITVCT